MEGKNIARKVMGVIVIFVGLFIFIGVLMRLTGYFPIRTPDDICETIVAPIVGIVAIIVGIHLLRTDAD
ncbi:MAG: hypothetical protein ACMUHM_03870 [Thermoplasmatota archaeon]